MSDNPSKWLPKTNKFFEAWCFRSPTPREILAEFNKLEQQSAEMLAMLKDDCDRCKRTIDEEHCLNCKKGELIKKVEGEA